MNRREFIASFAALLTAPAIPLGLWRKPFHMRGPETICQLVQKQMREATIAMRKALAAEAFRR